MVEDYNEHEQNKAAALFAVFGLVLAVMIGLWLIL